MTQSFHKMGATFEPMILIKIKIDEEQTNKKKKMQ